MTITLELEYDGAAELVRHLKELMHSRHESYTEGVTETLEQVSEAIDNENERRAELHQERLLESGGLDDSTYRREMKDAGRGHLVR